MPDIDFRKYTKAECDYGPGEWPRECGTCAHYSQSKPSPRSPKGQGNCYIVQGRIGEHDLCKFHVYTKGKEYLEDEGSEELKGLRDREELLKLHGPKTFENFQHYDNVRRSRLRAEDQARKGSEETISDGRSRTARQQRALEDRDRRRARFIETRDAGARYMGKEWCDICNRLVDPGHTH